MRIKADKSDCIDLLPRIRLGSAPLFVAVCAAALGCSRSDKSVVSGTVNVNGEPAKIGAISFFPVDGRASTAGAPIIDGKYTAEVTPGAYIVQIRVSKIVGEKRIYDTLDSPVKQIWGEALPARFNDATELRLEVMPGENRQNYNLQTQ